MDAEASAIRSLHYRLLRLHRDVWERRQRALQRALRESEIIGLRRQKQIGPLRRRTVRGFRSVR